MQKKVSEAEINKAIRLCVDSGKIKLGIKTSIKNAMLGKGKLIILSSTAPEEKAQDIKRYAKLSNLAVYVSSLSSKELGSLCGKPFLISAILVENPGNSKILELVKT